MAKKRNKRNRGYTTRATQLADVRFGPEESTIKALIGEAQSNLGSELTSADAAAQSAIHFAKKARKPVRNIYKEATAATQAANQDVATAFGTVGAGADIFRDATTRERVGADRRLAAAKASALQELEDRKIEAVAGRQYAKNQAKADFRKSMGDLSQKLYDLGDRKGSFIAATAGQLSDADLDRQTKLDVANIGAKSRTDVANINAKNKGKGGKGGGGSRAEGGSEKPATNTELRDFRTDFTSLLNEANRLFERNPRSRNKLKQLLLRGRTIQPGEPQGRQVSKAKNSLALSVALDMKYDGHVSRANAKALKQVGIRVADVPGLTSYTDWRSRRTEAGGGN